MAHGDITHVEIGVADTGRAADLYRDLFGWDIQEAPGFEGYPMWQAPNQLSGGGFVSRDAAEQPLAYVEVDSIADVLTKVEAAGGHVVVARTPISDTAWSAVFTDPEGNTLGLFEGEVNMG